MSCITLSSLNRGTVYTFLPLKAPGTGLGGEYSSIKVNHKRAVILFSQDVNPSSPIWGRKMTTGGIAFCQGLDVVLAWLAAHGSGEKGGGLCDKNTVIQLRVWEERI